MEATEVATRRLPLLFRSHAALIDAIDHERADASVTDELLEVKGCQELRSDCANRRTRDSWKPRKAPATNPAESESTRRKFRFTDEPIPGFVSELEAGPSAQDVSRRHNVSAHMVYPWRKRFGAMTATDVRRMRLMEQEISQRKRIIMQTRRSSSPPRRLSAENVLGLRAFEWVFYRRRWPETRLAIGFFLGCSRLKLARS